MLPDKLTPCPSPNLQGTFGGRKPTFGRAAVPKPGGMLLCMPKVERSQAEIDAYEQRLVEECESMSRAMQRDTSKVRSVGPLRPRAARHTPHRLAPA